MRVQLLALGIATAVLAIAACASDPAGSGTEWWRPPPDYNRGPQIRNNP